MSVATTSPRPWDTQAYLRIVQARYDAGFLIVTFGDGGVARIHVERMDRVQERGPDWEALRFDHFMVTVPTRQGDFEIPWFPIRSMTDPAFAAHLDATAARSARWVGRRVGELRRGRGLSVDALAAAADLPREVVETVEAGTHDGDLGELERIVRAMDREMKDLHRPRGAARDVASRQA